MEGVAVVGLGAMGLAMARTLADAGFAVTGYDISAEQREAFAPSVASLGDLASTHTVVLSLPDDAAVVAVVDELMDRLERGAVIVDTSTIGAETARRMQADAASQGVGYVDAPVSGGPAGAASGTLLMMIGGADRDVDIAMPILAALARKVVRCGGPGAGAVVKLANNVLCAGHLLLAAEALRLASAGGVSAEAMLAAVNAGSGRSAVTEVNLPRWVLSDAFDSGFSMGLMAKDVALAARLPGAGRLCEDLAAQWSAAAARLGSGEDFNRIVEGSGHE